MHDVDDEDIRVLDLEDGRIEFTTAGRKFYTGYFGYAGIDIRQVKTRADLDRACHAAFPYLFTYAEQRLKKCPQTLEIRALRAVVQNDTARFERIYRQLQTRHQLAVIQPSGGHSAPP